jgi:hypothetical protein
MRRLALVLALAACGKSDPAPAGDPPGRPDKAHDPKEKPHHREDRKDRQEAPSQLSLDVVDGANKSHWDAAAFAQVSKIDGKANDGEGRDTWSLRALVDKHAGGARVAALTGEDGKVVKIDKADWDNKDKTPILHSTRRGTLKFRWADKTGAWGDTVLKDVTAIELAR